MVLDDVRNALARAKEELGAASCTFYVRDPFWPDELRLIDMPGVRLREPMHGFSFPPHSKRVLAEGKSEIFSRNSRGTKQLREAAGMPLDDIPADRRVLFGDFIERECIESSARLWYLEKEHVEEGDIPDGVLFVNYAEANGFDKGCRGKIQKLLDQLVANLPELRDELRMSEMDALVHAIRIFPPKYADTAGGPGERDKLKRYLESLLRLAIDALGLDPDKTFGTVHLYDAGTRTLNLKAHYGKIKNLKEAKRPLSIPTGQGIISWVAIRRKAILIPDLADSAFAKIHIPISKGVRSEVAIPIFDGEKLLGVLNLESYLPKAFPATCVRSLWFAVNRAAEAVRLSQQADINKRLSKLIGGLLELCADAVRGKGVRDFPLNRLAELAAEELQAARCGIWRYDAQDFEFKLSGISPQNFDPKPPRRDGWSGVVQDLECSVWIDIKGPGGDFSVRYWKDDDWVQPPPGRGAPGVINPSVEPGVKSLLGIPIKVRNQRTGIAWLEYESSPETYTESELMKLASGFAAYAGLVIEFSQVDLVDKKAVQDIGDRLSEQLLSPGQLNLDGFPRVEVFVKSQNYGDSHIGGDFYAARVIDEKTAGVLLGDAEGHAVQGALNMLPMLTVFESFWSESRSVSHIMDKIMDTSRKMGVRGTAVYCVFNVMGQNLWLSVTSAGHDPLVIFPKKGGAGPFPEEQTERQGRMLGVAFLSEPLGEEHRRLEKGDRIVVYTDGLGLRLNDVVSVGTSNTEGSPADLAEAIFKKARAKRNGEPFDDDATVLVISVT